MDYLKKDNLQKSTRDLASLISERFGSIRAMSLQTGFARVTIYAWLDKGEINPRSKDTLRGRGFNPDTLERLAS